MQYGLQMYSLRDIPRAQEEEAFAAAAEAGYRMVELCGDYTVDDCEALAGYLKKYALKPISAHVDIEKVNDDYSRIVPFYRDLGIRDLIVNRTYANRSELEEFIRQVGRVQKRLNRDEMRLGYHMAERDFYATEDNIIPYPELMKHTDMYFEMNAYWAFRAGMDSIRLLERMRDRIKYVHLRDGSFDGKTHCAIGEGEVPVEAVRAKAAELGFTVIVENECLTPSGKAAIGRSMEYLRRLDALDGR